LFCNSAEVRIFTSVIDQRKTQNQLNFNAYASRMVKRFCSDSPNEAIESFGTVPTWSPKQRINLTDADAEAATAITHEQSTTPCTVNVPMPISTSTQEVISVSYNDNISRLAELESTINSINSERISLQADHQSLQAEFQKVITSALQHSNQIQAIQSDMRSLSSMVLKIRSALLLNAPLILPRSTFSSMRITDVISSTTSVPVQSNAPSSPRSKAPRGDQIASPSHNLTTGDSQIALGISSNPRECGMNTPSGLDQY
jgi:hypothetical protein